MFTTKALYCFPIVWMSHHETLQFVCLLFFEVVPFMIVMIVTIL